MAIKQRSKSLKSRSHNLSDTMIQLKVLNGKELADAQFPNFKEKTTENGGGILKPKPIEIFQLNIGKLCNQSCAHCHVDAGPDKREENMDRATLETCLEIIRNYDIPSVDITGGAPEMNPDFRWFVEEAAKAGIKDFIVRSNLTIIRANKKYYLISVYVYFS